MDGSINRPYITGLLVGTGIDMVKIERIAQKKDLLDNAFFRRGFTAGEQEEAKKDSNPAEYLAGRYAVKEAVFKAVAPLTPEKIFDFRIVETLRCADGSPRVVISDELRKVLDSAGVDDLMVSISNEGEYAIAICQAVRSR